jgi:hypothetical protein
MVSPEPFRSIPQVLALDKGLLCERQAAANVPFHWLDGISEFRKCAATLCIHNCAQTLWSNTVFWVTVLNTVFCVFASSAAHRTLYRTPRFRAK